MTDKLKNLNSEKHGVFAVLTFAKCGILAPSRNANRMKFVVFLFVSLSMVTTGLAQQDAASLKKIFQENLASAQKGDSYAQAEVGYAYGTGKGIKKDFQQAVHWYRKAAEQGNAFGQSNLGHMYQYGKGTKKDLKQAVQWYRKAAEQGYARAQYDLGSCYQFGNGVKGDLAQAVAWYRNSANQEYSHGQYRLGLCYQYGMGVEKNFTRAAVWFQKAAEQGNLPAKEEFLYLSGKINGPSFLRRELRQILGKPESSSLIEDLEMLALVFGRFDLDTEKAEILSRVLARLEKMYGHDSIKTVKSRSSLAYTLEDLEDEESALSLLQKNARIVKTVHGINSFENRNEIYRLGEFYSRIESYDTAIKHFEESRKNVKIKPEHLNGHEAGIYYDAKYQVALAYYAKQDLKRARRALRESITEREQASYNCDELHQVMSLIFARLGQKEQAAIHVEKWFRKHSFHPAVRAYYAISGQNKNAEEIYLGYLKRERDRSDSHSAAITREYANYCAYTKQFKKAVALQEDARQLIARYTEEQLPKLTESQRNDYISKEYFPSLHKSLSLGLNQRDSPRAAALSAGWLINGKAVTEEALAEASLLSSEDAYPTVQKLGEVRQELASTSVNFDTDDSKTKKRIAELESEQARLQNELAKFKLGGVVDDHWVPVGTIINSLSGESRFITIAKFRPFDVSKTYTHLSLDWENSHFSGAWLSEKYVAWVVPPLGLGNVQCIDLGDASKIDNAISRVRKQLVQAAAEMGNASETKLEADLKSELGVLSKLVLKPLDQYIEDVSELIISPDGELWTIPWELLHDGTKDGEYLIESKRIRYVSSGRELVRKLQPRSAVGAPVIFADPNYDLAAGKQQDETAQQFPLRGLKSTRFLQLASSAAEAEAIAPSIKEFAKEKPKLLTSFSALESEFKKLHRPKVLAISTHGYFEQNKRIKNPLLRCGLALAGANNRQQAMAEGKEDGILTGLEIVGTDLRGTELVVLSACETGLGEVTSGEGVAGLRQAFQLAGAQSVVSSLWQVEDGETARLMKLFFENLADGKSKSEALRQAQLSRIKARRARHGAAHPFFWAAFTLTGQD